MVSVVLFTVLAAVMTYLYRTAIRFAAQTKTVMAPNAWEYDVVVNREGVIPYSTPAAWFDIYSTFPALIGLIRQRRGPRGWAVRVRPYPYRRYADLALEVTTDRATALKRQAVLVELITRGEAPWPLDREWWR